MLLKQQEVVVTDKTRALLHILKAHPAVSECSSTTTHICLAIPLIPWFQCSDKSSGPYIGPTFFLKKKNILKGKPNLYCSDVIPFRTYEYVLYGTL